LGDLDGLRVGCGVVSRGVVGCGVVRGVVGCSGGADGKGRLLWWALRALGVDGEDWRCRGTVPESVEVRPVEEVWVVAPMATEAPTAPTMPSDARPVWSRLLR
jgi:hypothetical protein